MTLFTLQLIQQGDEGLEVKGLLKQTGNSGSCRQVPGGKQYTERYYVASMFRFGIYWKWIDDGVDAIDGPHLMTQAVRTKTHFVRPPALPLPPYLNTFNSRSTGKWNLVKVYKITDKPMNIWWKIWDGLIASLPLRHLVKIGSKNVPLWSQERISQQEQQKTKKSTCTK